MSPKAVVVRLVAKDKDAQEKLLKLLRTAADHALKNEPGLRKYVLTTEAQTPLSQTPNERAIWVIEEYSHEPAYENHLRQIPIRELSAWLSVCLGEAPKIWTLEVQEDCNFTKPEVIGYEDPTIVFTDLGYKQGTLQSTLPYWKRVADVSKAESGTFVWGVALDRAESDKLAVIHVYESLEYLINVHAVSKEMQDIHGFTADLRTELAPHFLKFVGGYLWK